jgi:hypothetical protein
MRRVGEARCARGPVSKPPVPRLLAQIAALLARRATHRRAPGAAWKDHTTHATTAGVRDLELRKHARTLRRPSAELL